MPSRHQKGNSENSLVPMIWLAFYAIAVVGALAWPRHPPETFELTSNEGGARNITAQGKTVWK